MHDIKLVTVFITPEMYNRFFISNPNVNCYDLIGIDNRQLNRGLPVIYNETIENHINDDCWLFLFMRISRLSVTWLQLMA